MSLEVDALYARHRDELLVFLARRTADPEIALDLWAETFAEAVAGRRRYRGTTDAEAAGWLYGIARRQLAQYYRRGRIEQRALGRLKLERAPAGPEVLAEIARRAGLDELRSALAAALAQLSPGIRGAVALRVVDELPYPVVAGRLGIAEPAARARVSRGLAALADLLDAPTIDAARTP
ncbi:ECF RNA polymerase sigma factor SigE [Paraconexibacter sp. AEG42_29]|uniref:ECF RNA polymerase sigma factor SigE n=1 Tax=Paraconexibacter sp. AEG42_29 TaxID=2997339 RepID=A0AAU7B0U3_9ACTN